MKTNQNIYARACNVLTGGVSRNTIYREPHPYYVATAKGSYITDIEGVERILCPRVHFKSVIVDGRFAYSGSANLTGAGMGAKSKEKRGGGR